MSDPYGRRLLVDDFHVGPVLGTGGFSVVRAGVRKQDNLQVAIKTLKKFGYGRGDHGRPGAQMSQAEALVKNEIMVMMRIVDEVSPHPNVIHLIDVYEDDGAVHLVLELCRGGELFDRIVQHERYSERDAAKVVRQIASGLAALHQAQIVHRDLKPENCLYVNPLAEAPLKIMDFGLSYIHHNTNSIVGIFGSIDYMAPEQLSLSGIMPANDMWSLGVILYILLCGYPPFRARSSRDKQMQILTVCRDHTAWKKKVGEVFLMKRSSSLEGCCRWIRLRVPLLERSSNGQTATLKEFEEVLRSINLHCFVPLAPRIFELFDYNHDGGIDLREVVCGFSLLRTSHLDDALQMCFKIYDRDDSGYISKGELARVLGALPEDYLPADISQVQMDDIFEHVDTDSDGRISYQEFRRALSLQDAVMNHFRMEGQVQ
ncbi:calcium and calcium/calmodulin-dependent serine/threonine-protein kinase isoform X2 [Physcomitrium patens]|uniref:calcium and calcium/calmodulin-dependent serine/threonine-protein kinase isoform X2 n=1 Tax=Physcomitrium patens TaxID=3218 RepID=UPI003CCD910A